MLLTFPLDGMEAGWFGAGMNSSEKKIAKALLAKIEKHATDSKAACGSCRESIEEYHSFLQSVQLRKAISSIPDVK